LEFNGAKDTMDLNNLLGRVLNAGGQILDTPGKKMAAGGAAAGILLTETGRDLAGAAVKYGGIAAIGALALHAWQRSQETQAAGTVAAPEPAPTSAPGEFLPRQSWPPQTLAPPVPAENAANQNHARLLLGAMINAAKADGSVDAEEQNLILGHADKLSLSQEERSFLFQELNKPFDMEPIVLGATTPELAAEVYAASRIAVGAASPAENAYLHVLAGRLKLPEAVARQLDGSLAAAGRA
jgi:uncharacterized membrane protein YebE (DUF533 family)